jgi:hypothetical protein
MSSAGNKASIANATTDISEAIVRQTQIEPFNFFCIWQNKILNWIHHSFYGSKNQIM